MSTVTSLIEAARRTWDAYLDFGPVDDGRPEGDRFEAALDALMAATHEARYDPDSGHCPDLEILVQRRRTPGGRGRNAARYYATTRDVGWDAHDVARAMTREEAVGRVLLRHLAGGEPPPRVVVTWDPCRPAAGGR